MRRNLRIGIGAGAAAVAITASMAGVASAAAGGHQLPASVTTASTVNRHITKAQARHIALAAVRHSRVVEIESDDRHDRAVWKVTLATPHGRVIVDVDKRTGRATILRGGSGDRRADGRDDRGGRDHRGDRHDHDRDDALGR
jgi:uncharacterized membrane protein YkoI